MSIPHPLINFRAPRAFHDILFLRARSTGLPTGTYVRRLLTEAVVEHVVVEALQRYDVTEIMRRLTMPLEYPSAQGRAPEQTESHVVLRGQADER